MTKTQTQTEIQTQTETQTQTSAFSKKLESSRKLSTVGRKWALSCGKFLGNGKKTVSLQIESLNETMHNTLSTNTQQTILLAIGTARTVAGCRNTLQ
ncbi:MAG: hypothetical protein HUK17_05435 [Bacteroidales bacterium]|nr:hypothetical protein [Bacteroidales bacterium]